MNMKQLHIRGFAFVFALMALVACPSNAQESRPTFTVQTANGQSTFHIGERISLKLTFTSPNDTQFAVAPQISPRHGEFDRESFDVSPKTGWTDPLATYFTQDFISTGHGLFPPSFLKSKPIEILVDLNQWVRFDEPGIYRVTITSYRVADVHIPNWEENALTSNALELRIIAATPEWQDAALKTIIPNLVRTKPEFQSAMADLRYLATRAGIDEMTSRMHSGDAYDITYESSLGLIGLPDSLREVGIASLNKRLAEPDYPISGTFFQTMSMLHVATGSDKEGILQQRHSFDPTFWQAVFSAVPKKVGFARATTLQTLLIFGRNMSAPEVKSQMALLLSAAFVDLDMRSQIDDLEQHWDTLRPTNTLASLETLAKLPIRNDEDRGFFAREELKSVAFKRWYELDPAGARNEILAEIGTPEPALSAQALRFMPEKELPEFESIWADAFLSTTHQLDERVLGSLLVRFGTGAATSRMIAKLNEPPRDYPCDSHVLALAYLVKFSPNDARPLLKREIAISNEGCEGSWFRWISEHASGPVLNDVADEALNDANPHTVIDAIQYLTLFGTKADEQFIWDRFVKWTHAWAGKAETLDHPEGGRSADYSNVQEGELLGIALISNQGWLVDQAFISRVVGMCIGKDVCDRIKSILPNVEKPYRVHLPDMTSYMAFDGSLRFVIAQYTIASRELLDAKVSQFPAGTKFVLSSASSSNDEQRRLEDEVRAIFKKYGMILEKQIN
jgi:hypothetical protein